MKYFVPGLMTIAGTSVMAKQSMVNNKNNNDIKYFMLFYFY